MLNPNSALNCTRATGDRHGAQLLPDGTAVFRLWAPAHERVQLAIAEHPALYQMRRLQEGWHEIAVRGLRGGARYEFVLPDGRRVPDPASHFQPDGVNSASELVDPSAYTWRARGWRGKRWHTAVLYELHVGTFTPAGTFDAVIEKLGHLVSLGVTALQIMPVAAFPGRRNWGYDGVFPYACASAYGRPDDLKRLVDEAHARDLMVLLDVVYNHFGPEGNFLSLYAPQFFTERHQTPWGAGINFDGAHRGPVRQFFIDSAVRWIEEFRFDGLRLDAVHAIVDDSDPHFLEELAGCVRECAPERFVHLVLENEENQASRLKRYAVGQPITFTAQWNDDVHHVLHTAATNESCGYYEDYHGDTQKLGRAIAEGFAFQGEVMRFRGTARGEASWFLPPDAFVAFIQNHDQIGNRARGERLSELAAEPARRAVAALYLLLPQIPMLFMGEEWDARQPFPFFCDFEGELAEAVRKGRRAEFSHLPEFSDPASQQNIPDPLAEKTFSSALLRWTDREEPAHARWLEWYRRILVVRRAEIVPRLPDLSVGESSHCVRGPLAITVQWVTRRRSVLQLEANLCDAPSPAFPPVAGRTMWLEGGRNETGGLLPWTVRWAVIDV
jgi:malto-oligosyltrehalose trehalohydrolase